MVSMKQEEGMRDPEVWRVRREKLRKQCTADVVFHAKNEHRRLFGGADSFHVPAFLFILSMYMPDSAPQFSLAGNLAQDDQNRITYFAVTDARNKQTPFGIKKEDRSRHAYVIGKTGMGKSTLLENMAIQDIQNGEGLAFIDPHGSTADKLMDYVPEERVRDVLYFAPFDLQYPISFNVLEDVDADKRHLVVAGLMSTFEKLWADQWSARMAYILQNTLGALLEFSGATILGVNRMYIDKEYRKKVIENITDPSVRSFWVDEYSKYTDRYTQEATPAIQNKIGQFASNALVRNIIGQPHSAFNIRELMDQKKIFIVNLAKGRIGEGNANLLGSMLITKIYLAAMSRADQSGSQMKNLPDFYLYVDEFQNFANRSFADILSEARKYKLCLTIAHQYIEQMEEEVRAAVFGNIGTMMTFRVGAYDAEVLEKEFAPVFSADDLVNLGRFQLYLKLMIDGISSKPFSGTTMPRVDEPAVSHRERVIAHSRQMFSRPREEVEKEIRDWVEHAYGDSSGSGNSDRPPQRDRTPFRRDDERRDRPPQRRDERRTERDRASSRSFDRAPRTDRPRQQQQQQERQTAQPGELRAALAKIAVQSKQQEKKDQPAPMPRPEQHATSRNLAPSPVQSGNRELPPESRNELKGILAKLTQQSQQREQKKMPQAKRVAERGQHPGNRQHNKKRNTPQDVSTQSQHNTSPARHAPQPQMPQEKTTPPRPKAPTKPPIHLHVERDGGDKSPQHEVPEEVLKKMLDVKRDDNTT